jgi:hypothetical protein
MRICLINSKGYLFTNIINIKEKGFFIIPDFVINYVYSLDESTLITITQLLINFIQIII